MCKRKEEVGSGKILEGVEETRSSVMEERGGVFPTRKKDEMNRKGGGSPYTFWRRKGLY